MENFLKEDINTIREFTEFMESLNNKSLNPNNKVTQMFQEAVDSGKKIQLGEETTKIFVEAQRRIIERISFLNEKVTLAELSCDCENTNNPIKTSLDKKIRELKNQNSTDVESLYILTLNMIEHEKTKEGTVGEKLTTKFIETNLSNEIVSSVYSLMSLTEVNSTKRDFDNEKLSYIVTRLYNNKDLINLLNNCHLNYNIAIAKNKDNIAQLRKDFSNVLEFVNVIFTSFFSDVTVNVNVAVAVIPFSL